MLLSDQAVFAKRTSPVVGAAYHVINLEARGETDYYGHLYVGSGYAESSMIFDTTSVFTIVNTDEVDSDLPSSYVISESTTAAS